MDLDNGVAYIHTVPGLGGKLHQCLGRAWSSSPNECSIVDVGTKPASRTCVIFSVKKGQDSRHPKTPHMSPVYTPDEKVPIA